jgi:hypothetical protein
VNSRGVTPEGLATRLWESALSLDPELSHSTERSQLDTKWACSVGGGLPPVRRRLSARQAVGYGARLMIDLHRISHDD